ncbi:hypothetical protein [Pseudomonas sp. zfem002]|uniref:RCC1 domain-containing protein n=1 Tax=Pseudomonas sp. zfem002 TaxID=3078197 RepID=UPI0029298FAD|nr:hypothetical protein [Pseudomonas sp. zfem002]MDU9390075.1 hypothetical protein [Pseudomonas sp. zfem002]
MTSTESFPANSLLEERIRQFNEWVRARHGERERSGALVLDPVYIPNMIMPVQTEGAVGGVNHMAVHTHASGLLIIIQAYLNMKAGDWIKVFWGNDSSPVTSGLVHPGQEGENFPMYIAASQVPEGVNDLYCVVVRAGSGNEDESERIGVLVRTVFPGGTDPEPDVPGHQHLAAPEPELPDSGVIDEEAARNGVKVTIPGYPNMRVYDTITLSWGGQLLEHEVTEADVGAGSVDFLVTEEVILEAGDSDALILVYRVMDEVHNQSSEWSIRTSVQVEVGLGLFPGPVILNPDPDADPYEVIDLDLLGTDDLIVQAYAYPGSGLQLNDVVAATWIGTTAQGETVTVTPDAKTVTRMPMELEFAVPNADAVRMSAGRALAFYTVTRDGSVVGPSKRYFVSFLGSEQKLPKPTVLEAIEGVLAPDLAEATVNVPGDALGAGDTVRLTWLGTRSDGSALLEVFEHNISGGNAGKPWLVPILGEKLIAPLNGGSLSLYYKLLKFAGPELDSERELLRVGEAQFELPAPFTRPPSDGGVLDPEELPAQLDIVVSPYSGMKADQTVHLVWSGSGGTGESDYMPISEHMEGKEVLFQLGKAKVEEYLGQDIELSYRVESDDEPTRLSAIARFSIGAKQAPLPLPVVVEAVDGILNPSDALQGATVRIPVEADLEFGDEVEVTWQGDKPGGVTKESKQVFQGDVGKPFDLTIDYEYVEANAEGMVVVSYQVFKQDGSAPVSGTLTLRVQRATLPLPVILEAEGDQLNPDDVLNGATVRIDAAVQVEEGNTVYVLVASSASGGSTTISYLVPPGGGGQPVQVTIPYTIINASNGTTFDLAYEVERIPGGPVEASGKQTYTVNREVGSGPLRVMGARFNVNTYRASSAPRMISAFHDTTLAPMLAEWRYEDSQQWTARTHWFDNKPWLKLYVRSESQTLELRPCNVVGNGADTTADGAAAFVAMRDEVVVGSEPEVDMRAWGNETYGGKLSPTLITIKNVAEITGSGNGYVARLRDGYVVRWGGAAAPEKNGTFEQVRSNAQAFVGRLSDGSLYAWGPATHGVPVSQAVEQHRDYVEVLGAAMAFAARRASGHVVAWGDVSMGGQMKEGQEAMGNIVQLAGNYGAFAALRDGGGSKTVIAWGHTSYGGDVSSDVAKLTNIKALGAATAQAFSVLLDDGGLQAWGAETHGGVVHPDILAMKDIVEISSTWHAMCARRANGHVVAWGNEDNGGDVGEDIAKISNIVSVVGSAWSFAALRRDGTVVAWGDAKTGGDTTPVAAQLVNVRAIYANSHGFTALTHDGRVVTWGVAAGGGDSSAVQPDLTGKLTHSRVVPPGEAALLDPAAAQEQGKA